MDELKRLRSSRRGYRTHLKRIIAKVSETLEEERDSPADIACLTDLREQLQRKRDILTKLDSSVIEHVDEEGELEAEVCETEEIQASISENISQISRFLELKEGQLQKAPVTTSNPLLQPIVQPVVTAEAVVQTQTVETSSVQLEDQRHRPSPVSPVSEQVRVDPPSNELSLISSAHARSSPGITRLPKLSIPNFSGNALQWQSFWDCFEAAVHSNPSLTGVQKLNYLRAQLQGEAAKVVAGFPLTNANYEHSVTLLTERFGQPHKLVQAHMQALLDMPNPDNSLTSLQLFHDSIESHMRSLSSLGKSNDSYGALLVPIILGKLPTDTKKNIARDHENREWTISDLQGAILKEIHILELGIQNTTTLTSQLPAIPTASFITTTTRRRNHTEGAKKHSCVFCKGNHSPLNCDVVKEHQKRVDTIKREKLCFNCFGHHKISVCTSKYRCRKCNRKHHTSICNNQPDGEGEKKNSGNDDNTTTLTTITPSAPHDNVCLLKTAIATVVHKGVQTRANILFDEGSQRSFLSQRLANNLAIRPYQKETIHLSSFGTNHPFTKIMEVTQIQIKTRNGQLPPLSTLITPTIATPLRNTASTSITNLTHLKGLPLAHPVTGDKKFDISLLIGADHYWDLVGDEVIRGNGPTAVDSKLGYLLSGPLTSMHTGSKINSLHIGAQHDTGEHHLDRFWNIEATGVMPAQDCNVDAKFLESYSQTCISRLPDGSYCAGFPWKQNHPTLPTNFDNCRKRTRSLAHRVAQTPDLLKAYDTILTDQINRGFIEKVDSPHVTDKAHYIPHHPVEKESLTTPIRIVYNCSSRQSSSQPSLNDCLLTGPPFLNDLCSIILRFRTHKYGVTTDIEKAFLHVTLHEGDRDFTRFLWLSQPMNPKSEFNTYRFKRVLFGAVCSPFMLYATLRQHLTQHKTPISTDILKNLYVDNIITGRESETQIVEFYKSARSLMMAAKFNLRTWASNSKQLNSLALADKIHDGNNPTNILGIHWNTSTDQLSLAPKKIIPANITLVTKRDILQDSSKIFDPIGLAAPITIRAKLLLQRLWQMRIHWDEPLEVEIAKEWNAIASDIKKLPSFPINRCYFATTAFTTFNIELHVFADASTKAYGAVAFLCTKQETSFVMAKSRVAPLKTLTLPKLELMAALVATRLANFIIHSLTLQQASMYVWTDSQIVLHWIQSTKVLPQFVAHRVSEIKQTLPKAMWKYCPTSDNPADLLTRGLTIQQFISSPQWQQGPTWLTEHDKWPSWNPPCISHLHTIVGVTEAFIPPPQVATTTGLHQIIKLVDYSTLDRLLVVTALVIRALNNFRSTHSKRTGFVTANELQGAKMIWIKTCQRHIYWKELSSLQSNSAGSKQLPLIRQLRLFLDDSGFIRCGGRIHNAPLSQLAKFPYLLPPRHHLTALIIYSAHAKLFHAGVNSTLTAVRQVYWIPTGRQYIKVLLRRCVTCKKHSGKPYKAPDMAPLPKVRLQDTPPFTVTGIDFTGALYIRQDNTETKAYICLFTCATTRAVHLEVVTDLSMETFLLAFRRFSSRKSLPQVIMSDNASTYLSAAEELGELLNSVELEAAMERRGVVWKFITKKAPWHGGYWERLIGLTKTALKKVLGRAHINLVTLQTLVVEIETILNNRPLTYVSDDPKDMEPLTPSHLLYGRQIVSLPYNVAPDELTDPDYGGYSQLKKRAKTQALLLEHFSSRWRHEYLTSLRESHNSSGDNRQRVKVGDVVLVHDEGPRINWRLAVIKDLIMGGDNLVRTAVIRTSTGETNRPITKLYPLEVRADMSSTDPPDNGNETPVVSSGNDRRPQRESARKANGRMAEWIQALRGPPEDVRT